MLANEFGNETVFVVVPVAFTVPVVEPWAIALFGIAPRFNSAPAAVVAPVPPLAIGVTRLVSADAPPP